MNGCHMNCANASHAMYSCTEESMLYLSRVSSNYMACRETADRFDWDRRTQFFEEILEKRCGCLNIKDNEMVTYMASVNLRFLYELDVLV